MPARDADIYNRHSCPPKREAPAQPPGDSLQLLAFTFSCLRVQVRVTVKEKPPMEDQTDCGGFLLLRPIKKVFLYFPCSATLI